MLARNEIILKWTLYAAAALLCVFAQGLLQNVQLWGVIPFLYPMLPAIPATYEAPLPSTIFSLCIGAVCDILVPGPIPCFHTLVFPVTGLLCALLARSVLPAGYLCSCVGSIISFGLTGLFHCFLLSAEGQWVWNTGMLLALRELCITLPLVFPVTVLFRAVYRKTHMYD